MILKCLHLFALSNNHVAFYEFLEGGLHKIQNENLKQLTKSALDTQSLLYLNATGKKNAHISQSISPSEKNIYRKTQHKERSSNQPPQSWCAVFFRGCIIFTSQKKPTPYCSGSPAVLCPLHLSNPQTMEKRSQQHALNIHEKMKSTKQKLLPYMSSMQD